MWQLEDGPWHQEAGRNLLVSRGWPGVSLLPWVGVERAPPGSCHLLTHQASEAGFIPSPHGWAVLVGWLKGSDTHITFLPSVSKKLSSSGHLPYGFLCRIIKKGVRSENLGVSVLFPEDKKKPSTPSLSGQCQPPIGQSYVYPNPFSLSLTGL